MRLSKPSLYTLKTYFMNLLFIPLKPTFEIFLLCVARQEKACGYRCRWPKTYFYTFKTYFIHHRREHAAIDGPLLMLASGKVSFDTNRSLFKL